MPYNKEETDAYVKKYCVVWYCLQIGFVGLLAVIVIFSVVLQVHRGDDLTRMESLGNSKPYNQHGLILYITKLEYFNPIYLILQLRNKNQTKYKISHYRVS